MNAIESIAARKSTRAYRSKQISNSDLEIPEGYKPILCISLSYAKETESPRKYEISVNKVV